MFDPWLPPSIIEDAGAVPATLDDTLSHSTFVFVFATATAESRHLLDGEKLDLLPDGARLILVSRAAVVDYDALLERLRTNRFHAAIDVWPIEPIPADSEFLTLPNVVISAHRAGGIPEAFHSIGDMVCDDLELMAQGLPPARLQIRSSRAGHPVPQQACGVTLRPSDRAAHRQDCPGWWPSPQPARLPTVYGCSTGYAPG